MYIEPRYKIHPEIVEVHQDKETDPQKVHHFSSIRKRNHLKMVFIAERVETKDLVKKEVQKMMQRLNHLLEGGISFDLKL